MKVEQPLFFPEPMLRRMEEQAMQHDTSLSSLAQTVWRSARVTIAGFAPVIAGAPACPARVAAEAALRARYVDADHHRQTLFFPPTMLIEIEREARRLGCSMSRVVHLAWAVAEAELRAPSAR